LGVLMASFEDCAKGLKMKTRVAASKISPALMTIHFAFMFLLYNSLFMPTIFIFAACWTGNEAKSGKLIPEPGKH